MRTRWKEKTGGEENTGERESEENDDVVFIISEKKVGLTVEGKDMSMKSN